MKHLFTGIVIIAVILGLSIGSVLMLDRYAGQAVQELRLAEQSMTDEQSEQAADYANRAMELWRRHAGFYGAILQHVEIDEINGHFARLLSYAATDDRDEFLATCAELIALVDHLPDMEKAYYYNIL